MSHLPDIAAATERLGVTTLIHSSAHNWNNVIENEVIDSVTPAAFLLCPFFSLNGRKLPSVAHFLPRLGIAAQPLQHHIAVDFPALPERLAHLGSCFRRMLVTLRRPCLLSWSRPRALARLNLGNCFWAVRLSPKGIVCAAQGCAFAFTLAAGFAYPAANVRAATIKGFPANHTREGLTGFYVGHGSSDNRVNSVDTHVSVQRRRGNTEPSRIRNGSYATRDAEGVTTRGCGNNNPPTSARPEREDIVWAAWQHAEAGHKQAGDNITDEMLNIQPSDVFTAAEFPIRQAAVAVSISGLEMLQNAGKERMIDLLESRIQNAEDTFANGISYDIYSDGTQAGQINGLQVLVAIAPTTGIVGGIDRSQWTFWQNIAFSAVTSGGAAATSANIQSYMNRVVLQLVRGRDAPDLIVADTNNYRLYLESLQAIQRITSQPPNDGAAGFSRLAYFGAGRSCDVVLDGGFQGYSTDTAQAGIPPGGAPTSTMYFLNTKYMFYRPHSERDMVPLEPDRFSVNQDAMVKLIGWAGNLTISNCRLQGVLSP